jgi:tetratricopeptide (TPR) repeat protein
MSNVIINPDFDCQRPEYWITLGNSLCERQLYTEAIAAYDRALAIDPAYSKAWNNRGNTLSALHRPAEAIGSYDKAVMIQPDFHQAWFNRGLLLSEMGAYGNAIASFDQAIAINSDPRYLHSKETIWLSKKLIAV